MLLTRTTFCSTDEFCYLLLVPARTAGTFGSTAIGAAGGRLGGAFAKMHQIQFRLGLRPRSHWGSLQRSLRPPSWIHGYTVGLTFQSPKSYSYIKKYIHIAYF